MNLPFRKSTRPKLVFSQELYQRIKDQEEAIKLARVGLLTLRVASLEKEVSDLARRIEESRRHVAELPCEIERLEKFLREICADQKTLESLLSAGG